MKTLQSMFYKGLAWLVGITFLAQILAGTEFTLKYNHERAKKVKRTFWTKTLRVASYVGDLRRAIF